MRRPNILLITTDQQNAETLGCAGNPVIQTPNLDGLAREGAFFSQAFTSFPLCTPARTSIFTGQYAKHHGVAHNVNMGDTPGPPGLSPERQAFPELLAAAGYHTSFFGKLHARQEGGKNFGLHLARLVEGKGQFVGSPHVQDEYRRCLAARGYPPDIWKTWELPHYKQHGYVTSPLPERDYIDTFVADLALQHLDSAREPFFSWVSFCNPHTPLDPPRPYDAMYDPSAIPPRHRRRGELEEKRRRWVDQLARTVPAFPLGQADPSLPGGVENAYSRFPEDKTRRMVAAYYGEVSQLDAQVGRILRLLESRGLYENTLIIFTSDHGDQCGHNWAFYKSDALYDPIIRVPLIVRWPGLGAPGQSLGELVSLVDLMPTVLEAAGLPAPADLDGRSLRPLIAGEPAAWRQELLVESTGGKALVTPEWKLISWNDGAEELYDRINDPHDLHSLAGEAPLEQTQAALRRGLLL